MVAGVVCTYGSWVPLMLSPLYHEQRGGERERGIKRWGGLRRCDSMCIDSDEKGIARVPGACGDEFYLR